MPGIVFIFTRQQNLSRIWLMAQALQFNGTCQTDLVTKHGAWLTVGCSRHEK
jgi:hypothetical protein